MPFNAILFVNIIAGVWALLGALSILNTIIAKTDRERIASALYALFVFAVLGACLLI
jgi:hypothetical protein